MTDILTIGILYFILCSCVCACVYVCEEGIRYHRVIDISELPCGYWQPNPGPLKEQKVLLELRHLPSSYFILLDNIRRD